MKERVLARRYARALFEIALERKILSKVREEIHAFSALLEEHASLRNFFLSPEHPREAQKKVAEQALADRFSNVFFNFLLVLIDKRRQTLTREIVAAFEALYDRHIRKIRALAITAVPMDEATLGHLRVTLSKSLEMDMELQNRVEPEILGGLVVQVEGKILDGSVRQQLARLRGKILDSRT